MSVVTVPGRGMVNLPLTTSPKRRSLTLCGQILHSSGEFVLCEHAGGRLRKRRLFQEGPRGCIHPQARSYHYYQGVSSTECSRVPDPSGRWAVVVHRQHAHPVGGVRLLLHKLHVTKANDRHGSEHKEQLNASVCPADVQSVDIRLT